MDIQSHAWLPESSGSRCRVQIGIVAWWPGRIGCVKSDFAEIPESYEVSASRRKAARMIRSFAPRWTVISMNSVPSLRRVKRAVKSFPE